MIPTLGDRRASGHSIIGLAVFERSALRAEAIGRCWSQGRWLAWLAECPVRVEEIGPAANVGGEVVDGAVG
jgi:hypothetical protein